jgi:hypothetical protein
MAQVRLCPACRKTRLSRYNPEPLCAPCTRGCPDHASAGRARRADVAVGFAADA